MMINGGVRMIICFEEKDRAAIENRGMTIIEAKRIMYTAVKVFQLIFNRLWDICKHIPEEQIEEFIRENGES